MFVAALRPRIQGAPTSPYGISARRSNEEDGGAAPQPFGRSGVVVDLFVARRRRCPDIASFSLLDLASQAPSANITVFMEGSTQAPWRRDPIFWIFQPPTSSLYEAL